jgi:hypothetical protein
VRLERGEREGLALLERAMTLDPEAIKPACERAHAFLSARKETQAAEAYAERWRERDEMEKLRAHQLENVDPKHELVSHGLNADTIAALKSQLSGKALRYVSEAHIARRVIPADPSVVQLVVGVHLSWWGRQRSKQHEVVDRLAALEWPVPLIFLTVDGKFAPMKKKFRALKDARLV